MKFNKLLFDIQQSALDIEQFIHGIEYSEFEKSNLLQAAVERKFGIIGEALNRIKRFDSEFIEKISDYRRIIGFRNIIAHGYDIIECEVIWAAAKKHLPILKQEVDEHINT